VLGDKEGCVTIDRWYAVNFVYMHRPCFPILFWDNSGEGGGDLALNVRKFVKTFFFYFSYHNWAMILRLWQMIKLEEKESG